MTVQNALLLFPDLLELSDPMEFNKHFLRKGHGVWTIGKPVSYVRGEERSDYRHLCVIYDDGRFRMEKNKAKKWCVELRRYVYTYRVVETGWGKSRKRERKLFVENHDHERWFKTRDEACDFAEKLLSVFEKVLQSRETNQHAFN